MRRIAYLLLIIFTVISVHAQDNIEKPTIEQVKSKYEKQILRLEGVIKVSLAEKGNKELIIIEVKAEKDKKLLDNLLSDNLEGFEILFEVPIESQNGNEVGGKKQTKPLCFRCVGTKYPDEKGLCSSCGGWTDSTSFKLCNACATKKKVCVCCQKSFNPDK